jgi:putative tryptophan/tyrosine transport system substrate-binding protein
MGAVLLTFLFAFTIAPTAHAGAVLVLKSGALAPYEATVSGFRAAYRGEWSEASLDEGPAAIAMRLTKLRPDVVVVVGLKAALFAREHAPRIPLVFCVVQGWERYDLSGAWVTGVSTDVPAGVELAALRTAAPNVRSVGFLYGVATGAERAREARVAAAAAKITLVEQPLSSLSDLPAQARALAGRVDALWLPADPTLATPEAFRFLLELSLAQRKPLLVFSEALVRAGALVAVSPDYDWVGTRVAEAVRRILTGDRASDVPVLALRRTHTVVNPTTARSLGCPPPDESLDAAESVR